MVRVLFGVGGVVLVGATLLSAIRTFVLPRSARSFLTALVFRVGRAVFRVLAWGSYERKDRVLALFVPVTLFALAGTWILLVMVGFACLYFSFGYGSGADSLWVSGSSLLTLGTAPLESTGVRWLAFGEAAIGFGMVALLISFLPSLYAAFSRRETLVALLEVRAGTPPTAVGLIRRFERIGWTSDLSDEWRRWEQWFAEVEESHTSYPMLVWLRSPRPDLSWIVAAGAILDSAAIVRSAVDRPRDPMADLCIRAGFTALRQIAGFFGIGFDPHPAPDDPIAVTRVEFEAAIDELAEVGVPIRSDREAAWRDYAGWRVNYDTVLLSLAELVVAPIAPWVSDRSALTRGRPVALRWGRSSGSQNNSAEYSAPTPDT